MLYDSLHIIAPNLQNRKGVTSIEMVWADHFYPVCYHRAIQFLFFIVINQLFRLYINVGTESLQFSPEGFYLPHIFIGKSSLRDNLKASQIFWISIKIQNPYF